MTTGPHATTSSYVTPGGLRVAVRSEQTSDIVRRAAEVREQREAERRARQDDAAARYAALLARTTDPVLLAVLDQHEPIRSDYDSWGVWCAGCDAGAHAEGPADAPCSTFELIERDGVDEP